MAGRITIREVIHDAIGLLAYADALEDGGRAGLAAEVRSHAEGGDRGFSDGHGNGYGNGYGHGHGDGHGYGYGW